MAVHATKYVKMYRRMREDGLQPNISILLAALNLCVNTRDLDTGRKIHWDLCNPGYCFTVYVANNLIAMYSSCGSMVEALQVFDSIEERDVVSWNTMITGYVENGECRTALQFFRRMQVDGFKPDVRSSLAVLKACSCLARNGANKVECLKVVRTVHHEGEADSYVENALLDAYGNCESLVEARELFENMNKKNIVSWTSMIQHHAENGEAEVAWGLYILMQLEGFVPDYQVFTAALKTCELSSEAERLERMGEIHLQAVDIGSELDVILVNTLIGAYSRCGSLEKARNLFMTMKERDVISWTRLITGYVENGEDEQALELYACMHAEGCLPSEVTVVAVLRACSSLAEKEESSAIDGTELVKVVSLEKGMAIHSHALRTLNVESRNATTLANSLVGMYARCGDLCHAELVFERIRPRTTVSWNVFLLGCVGNGQAELALELYEFIHRDGCVPDRATFLAVLKACACLQHLEAGMIVHSQILNTRMEIDEHLGSSLVDMYAKCGSFTDAWYVFSRMKTRDVVAWNVMIQGYANLRAEAPAALELYERMKKEGCSPNCVTYATVLKACGSLGRLEAGRAIHAEIQAAKAVDETQVVNALVDFYGKCGSLGEAQEVFDSIPETVRSSVTWNSLIAGYSYAGEVERVLMLVKMMMQGCCTCVPDSSTFLLVLAACSHAGLVEECMRWFYLMNVDYGVPAQVEHYGCVVDLLCRVNRVEEAVLVIESMPADATKEVWMAVLGGCSNRGNVEIARRAFENVVKPNYCSMICQKPSLE